MSWHHTLKPGHYTGGREERATVGQGLHRQECPSTPLRTGPSTALPDRVGAGRASAKLCGLGFGGASGFGGFVEQVAFRLQPVLQLISGSAAALEVDFIGAKPDLFRCWMSFGSSRLGLRRWSNVHGLGHEFLLPFLSSGRSKATEQSIEQGRAKRARET